MNVLVTAASKEGATAEIAEAIAAALTKRGVGTTVTEPDRVVDVRGYDAFVIGSAVYGGHWLQPATELVDRIGVLLAGRPVWLFSSGPVGDPSRKLVQKMGGDPVDLRSLHTQTNAREHRIFRGLKGDFRNWAAIEQWAGEIADALLGVERSSRSADQTAPAGSG
jgi:menaquinone-dependent protoporphyrinogen oxidase